MIFFLCRVKINKTNAVLSVKILTFCMALVEQLSIIDDFDDLTIGGVSLWGELSSHLLMAFTDDRARMTGG